MALSSASTKLEISLFCVDTLSHAYWIKKSNEKFVQVYICISKCGYSKVDAIWYNTNI